MSTDIETVDLTQIVGELSIPCDFAEHDWCSRGAAEWAALTRCPSCGCSGLRLWCSPCQNLLMHTEDCLVCRSCDDVIAPARHLIAQMEKL